MCPILVWLYVRLARREEADMEAEFGAAYIGYKSQTGMFLPRFRRASLAQKTMQSSRAN